MLKIEYQLTLLVVLVSETFVLGFTIINLLCGLNKGVERKIDSVYDLIFDIKKEAFIKPKAHKPKNTKQSDLMYGECPQCGERVYSTDKTCKCGQKLDWSDNEVNEKGGSENG